MPEATILCVDNSDYMRNGDFFPSRMSGAQEACTLLIGNKMQSNPENTIGFLTMGGKACTVRETLTTDVDRVMASAATIPIGGHLHFAHGMQIAQLALSHRTNRRHEARIIAFVGSPIVETDKELEKLAKRLRKDGIAIDVIAFGVEDNVPLLDKFVATVDKDNNSHFVNVPVGSSIVNSALSGITGSTGAPAQDFSEYGGVDPSMDPELAMVLRMSLEEERQRVAAAADAEQMMAAGGTAGGSAATEQPAAAGASASPVGAQAAAAAAPSGGDRELSEEEQLELALKMSMQDAEDEVKNAAPAAAGDQQTPQGQQAPADRTAEFQQALQDEEFMRQLQEDAAKDDGDDVNDASKK